MNANTAGDDLAFLRALVEPDDRWQRQFGETYSAAGVCYCAQMLMHAGQFLGLAPSEDPVALAIGIGPPVVFLALLIWIIRTAFVALGWFAVGVAMPIFIDQPAGFVAAAGVGMFAFMLLPGLYLLRQAGRSA